MKKSRVTAILFSVLMIAAAVFYSVNDTHAGAYTGWGYQLPTGGDGKPTGQERPKIWGYSTSGGMGNTVVNGTLNGVKGEREYYATAYIETNLWHDVTYTVTVEVCSEHEKVFEIYASNTKKDGDTSGTNTSVTKVGIITHRPHARAMHQMESNLYGTFKGYTRINYF